MAAGKHIYSFLEKKPPMTITQHIMLEVGACPYSSELHDLSKADS